MVSSYGYTRVPFREPETLWDGLKPRLYHSSIQGTRDTLGWSQATVILKIYSGNQRHFGMVSSHGYTIVLFREPETLWDSLKPWFYRSSIQGTRDTLGYSQAMVIPKVHSGNYIHFVMVSIHGYTIVPFREPETLREDFKPWFIP
jgi:hypothetical protein